MAQVRAAVSEEAALGQFGYTQKLRPRLGFFSCSRSRSRHSPSRPGSSLPRGQLQDSRTRDDLDLAGGRCLSATGRTCFLPNWRPVYLSPERTTSGPRAWSTPVRLAVGAAADGRGSHNGRIVFLAAAPYSEYVINDTTAGPRTTLFIAVLLLTSAYLANVISVQLTAGVNSVVVVTEIRGTVVASIVLFLLWVVHYKPDHHGFAYLGSHFHLAGQPYWYAIISASLILRGRAHRLRPSG